MIRRPGHIVLAAGGTGGHVIPAQALAEELALRGHRLTLITDDRGARFAGWFEDMNVHVIPAGRLSRGGLAVRARAARMTVSGILRARNILRQTQPGAVVGFGGYPSLPAMVASSLAGVPSCLHEQNAVLGRVNRLLLHAADALAISFRNTAGLARARSVRTTMTGNPVRRQIAELCGRPYPKLTADGRVNLLVIGGSQGAAILSEVVPAAISVLPLHLRRRLKVTQQCRAEDIDRVRGKFRDIGMQADLATYFEDMPGRLTAAALVIARAGASTVSELAAAGRPAILVPLPGATDDHQTANAGELKHAGGAWLMPQARFTPGELAKRLHGLLTNLDTLTAAAANAATVARPQAAETLADFVEWLVRVRGASRVSRRPKPGTRKVTT